MPKNTCTYIFLRTLSRQCEIPEWTFPFYSTQFLHSMRCKIFALALSSSFGNRDYHAQNVESKTPICEFVVVVGPPIFPLDLLKEEYNRFAIPFIWITLNWILSDFFLGCMHILDPDEGRGGPSCQFQENSNASSSFPVFFLLLRAPLFPVISVRQFLDSVRGSNSPRSRSLPWLQPNWMRANCREKNNVYPNFYLLFGERISNRTEHCPDVHL